MNQLTKEFENKISLETKIEIIGEDIFTGKVKYDDVSKELQQYYKDIEVADKRIDQLRRKITKIPDEKPTGDTTQTSNLKTYTEIMGELIEKQKTIKLNNPFTPEEVRKNELFFEDQKKNIDNLIIDLLKLPGDYSTVIEGLKNFRIELLNTEKIYNQKVRDQKLCRS